MKLPLESSNPHSPKAAPKAGGKTDTPVGISEWPSSSNPPPGTSMASSTSGHAAAPLESMLTEEPHQLAVLEDALQAGSLAGIAWKLCCPDSSRLTGFPPSCQLLLFSPLQTASLAVWVELVGQG